MARYDRPVDVGAVSPQSLLRQRPDPGGGPHRHIRPAIAGDMPSGSMHVLAALQPYLSRSEPGVPYLPSRGLAGGRRLHDQSCSWQYLSTRGGGAKVLHFIPPMNWGVPVEVDSWMGGKRRLAVGLLAAPRVGARYRGRRRPPRALYGAHAEGSSLPGSWARPTASSGGSQRSPRCRWASARRAAGACAACRSRRRC